MSEKVSSLIQDRVGCIDGWYRTEEGEMRSPLMDAMDAVEAIESENVILCMQFADMIKSMNCIEEQCAELRKLCADMWFWGYEGHMDSQSQEWQMNHINEVLDRMCKLGVKAD